MTSIDGAGGVTSSSVVTCKARAIDMGIGIGVSIGVGISVGICM